MLTRLFPKAFDNAYRGHWPAIWILVLAAGMKGMQGAASIVDTRGVLTGPDAIPFDSYGADAQATVIATGALLGMYLLVVPLLSLLAAIRYRTMIPLMYLLLLATQLGSRVLLDLHPIARIAKPEIGFAGHPFGFYVNLFILALTAIGFVLSLRNRSDLPGQAVRPGEVS